VRAEISGVKHSLDGEWTDLATEDGQRRIAVSSLRTIKDRHNIEMGQKDNHYFAGRLVLTHSRNGREWAWGITAHYPIIEKIPADIAYVVNAYAAAEAVIAGLLQPTDQFESSLELAWTIARHLSTSDDVLVIDVARMFPIASQDGAFWARPLKQNFRDVPDGAFVANLVHWRQTRPDGRERFEFVPATLNQAHGPNARPFHLPANPEGTQTRPMIYLRRSRPK
jgi:hypothetical protein